MKLDRAAIALMVLVSGVVAVLYANSLSFGAMATWDDGMFVLFRPELSDWWGASWRERLLTPAIGYPIPVPTFIQAHIRLLFPESYLPALHALGVMIHLANGWLAFLLFSRWRSRIVGSIAASLWLLHPVCVESVVWLTNLKTLLALFFGLVALLVWDELVRRRHDHPSGEAENGTAGVGLYLALGASLLLALGSRPDTAILPILMGVSFFLTEAKRRPDRHAFAVVGGTLAFMGLVAFGANAMHDNVVRESIFAQQGPAARIIRIAMGYEQSLANLFFPVDLHPAYFLRADATVVDALPGLGLIVATALLIVFLWVRGDKILLCLLLMTAVLFAPYSNLLWLPRWTADTYLYGPGLFAVLVVVVAATRIPLSDKRVYGIAVLSVAALLSVQTLGQVDRWRTPQTLWAPLTKEHPLVDRPYRHIVFWHYNNDRLDEARTWLDRALPAFREQRAVPWYAVEIVRQTSTMNEALDLAMSALLNNHSPAPQLQRRYVELLAASNVPLPAAAEVRDATAAAVQEYMKHEDWLSQKDAALALAIYFRNQPDADELMLPFLGYVLREGPSGDCRPFELRRTLPAHVKDQLPPVEPPAECGEQ